MPLLLDTSVAIELCDSESRFVDRRSSSEEVFLSIISRVELEAGVYRDGAFDPLMRTRVDQFLAEVEGLDFTSREVEAYSAIIAARGFSRRLVVDRMIAATALANDLTLATLNPRDFRGIPSLSVEDWSSAAP